MSVEGKYNVDYYNEENSEENFYTGYNIITVRDEKVEFPLVLKNNLNGAVTLVENHFDVVFFVDGMEGSGKSELGKQCALILDDDFNEDNIVFTDEQFKDWVLSPKRKKGDVCLWDEFIFGGNSQDALTSMQNTLMKMFVTMRSKGLIVILIAPSLFLIRKYFAVFRTRFLLHCYTKGIKRGFVKFYNYTQKHMLVNYGYKTWLYSPKIKPSFTCKFSHWSNKFLDETKIEKKKQEAILSLGDTDKKENYVPTKKQREALLQVTPHLSPIFGHESAEYRTLIRYMDKLKINNVTSDKKR